MGAVKRNFKKSDLCLESAKKRALAMLKQCTLDEVASAVRKGKGLCLEVFFQDKTPENLCLPSQ